MSRAISNSEFAKATGCHHSMSSKMRNGHRMPSSALLSRIVKAFDLQGAELASLLQAVEAGPEAYGRWLQAHIFDEPVPIPEAV